MQHRNYKTKSITQEINIKANNTENPQRVLFLIIFILFIKLFLSFTAVAAVNEELNTDEPTQTIMTFEQADALTDAMSTQELLNIVELLIEDVDDQTSESLGSLLELEEEIINDCIGEIATWQKEKAHTEVIDGLSLKE